MSESIPSPRRPGGDAHARPRCPVCGTTVYSPSGIHPQCSVRRQEGEEKAALKDAHAAEAAAIGPDAPGEDRGQAGRAPGLD